MISTNAEISECGNYRYALRRIWDNSLPVLGWIMLNPSTADATADDPTIRRCIGFAKNWGYGGIDVRNLFAWRATDPKELLKLLKPSGEGNDSAIKRQLAVCGDIIVAWGKPRWRLVQQRAWAVEGMLASSNTTVYCLGLNNDGSPKHPLYLANETQRLTFSMLAMR